MTTNEKNDITESQGYTLKIPLYHTKYELVYQLS